MITSCELSIDILVAWSWWCRMQLQTTESKNYNVWMLKLPVQTLSSAKRTEVKNRLSLAKRSASSFNAFSHFSSQDGVELFLTSVRREPAPRCNKASCRKTWQSCSEKCISFRSCIVLILVLAFGLSIRWEIQYQRSVKCQKVYYSII